MDEDSPEWPWVSQSPTDWSSQSGSESPALEFAGCKWHYALSVAVWSQWRQSNCQLWIAKSLNVPLITNATRACRYIIVVITLFRKYFPYSQETKQHRKGVNKQASYSVEKCTDDTMLENIKTKKSLDYYLEFVSQELSYTAGSSSYQVLCDQHDSICCTLTQPIHHTTLYDEKLSQKN